MGAAGAERTDIKNRRGKRFRQGGLIEFRIMGERDDGGARIGLRVLIAPADAWIQEPRA